MEGKEESRSGVWGGVGGVRLEGGSGGEGEWEREGGGWGWGRRSQKWVVDGGSVLC